MPMSGSWRRGRRRAVRAGAHSPPPPSSPPSPSPPAACLGAAPTASSRCGTARSAPSRGMNGSDQQPSKSRNSIYWPRHSGHLPSALLNGTRKPEEKDDPRFHGGRNGWAFKQGLRVGVFGIMADGKLQYSAVSSARRGT